MKMMMEMVYLILQVGKPFHNKMPRGDDEHSQCVHNALHPLKNSGVAKYLNSDQRKSMTVNHFILFCPYSKTFDCWVQNG